MTSAITSRAVFLGKQVGALQAPSIDLNQIQGPARPPEVHFKRGECSLLKSCGADHADQAQELAGSLSLRQSLECLSSTLSWFAISAALSYSRRSQTKPPKTPHFPFCFGHRRYRSVPGRVLVLSSNREVTMFDAYSKVVLTVIAMALSGICVQSFVRGASAQFVNGCGGLMNPCYVMSATGLDVRVINMR